MSEPLKIGQGVNDGAWALVSASGELLYFDEEAARLVVRQLHPRHPAAVNAAIVLGVLDAERKRAAAVDWPEYLAAPGEGI